jgi:hypothetical protein
MEQAHPALQHLQQLHDQLVGLSPFAEADRTLLLHLASEALPELTRLAALDMSSPWVRQVRASQELVVMAQSEAQRPQPIWPQVLVALNAALYPWAHLPAVLPRSAGPEVRPASGAALAGWPGE